MADGTPGRVNDLLRWADGRLLVLVFGATSPAALQRLGGLAETAPVRAVQVLGPTEPAGALEHVRDPKGTCRAPATCSAMPGRWCARTATWPPPAKAWTHRWCTRWDTLGALQEDEE